MKKVLLIVLLIITITITSIGVFVVGFAMLWIESDKTTNVSEYNMYFGMEGKHKNDIFPTEIPSSAKVEDFTYYYYNAWDSNYVSYLVYSCNKDEYKEEVNRLSEINSSNNYLIYGATGFNYPVLAVYAGNYNGYIYALADEESNKLIYVEISFCDYICDIDYKKIIAEKYLPINFDALKGNKTREDWDKKHVNNF